MNKSLLDQAQVDAISRGDHDNPFSVLGLHELEKSKGVVIRTFQPYSEKVEVVNKETGKSYEMDKVSEDGLYELHLKTTKKAFPYHFILYRHEQEPVTRHDPYNYGTLISDFDLQIWGEGNHSYAYNFMGAHVKELGGVRGTHFVVCAPAAKRVSVIGEFNGWDGRTHVMRKYYDQGIWEIFIPEVLEGSYYKFEISSHNAPLPMKKADPYGFYSELRPGTASIVTELDGYHWNDQDWMQERTQGFDQPVSVYELHAGSWKKKENGDFLSYRELAAELIPYVKDMGFTHIELMPVAEHPYDPSWGYQITGYYAPTSRFGTPEDFMYFIDECHQAGIGVLLDWVPAHFTKDDHGLRFFDGTHLYEHADPRKGEHKDWGTNIFNFGRTEVMNFLISNAVYWLDKYHIDGLRVDAVASMLYLDYSRNEGEWIPNQYGGRENLEAIHFLKRFNEVVHAEFEGVVTMAEESTSWPMVSRPTYLGGLGFDYKWNMGWMNDTLRYMEVDPIFRKYHHNELTFSMIYAFTENFILPFSHDEVVHMKKSMLSKMPGDTWQKFANLRLLYAYMYAHPGKKLLFMGSEFGQWSEWNSEKQLDWPLLEFDTHGGLRTLISDLNTLYQEEPSLHQVDFDWKGFRWINAADYEKSVLSFIRYSEDQEDYLIFVFNFTPEVYHDYVIGVPEVTHFNVIFNSDSEYYGGSNVDVPNTQSQPGDWNGLPANMGITIPPLGCAIYKPVKD
ncbi:MAG: 1,4-alpha-glucan branching protein GlgB [Bacteroidetes bacterium]|nr:1,4-alpha-glucan branching protein GlgB [Bacteroidota bacterium]MCH8524460.1 1,4-alpha-glucan branching protein GlgB [Balneolales bacterium]